MSHLSYSQFRTFDDCPRRYWHTYIAPDAKRPLPTSLMVGGSKRHAEIAADIEHGAFDALPNGWGDRIKERKEGGWTLLVEHECELSTPYAPIKCVIDLMMISPDRSRVEIVDWKASRLPEDDAQMQVYACAAQVIFPEVSQFKCTYALTDRAGWKNYHYDADEVTNFYRSIRRKAYEMKNLANDAESYKKVPSPSCQTCPFAIRCVGDMHALPLHEMGIEELIEMAYLAAGVESQCKEAIRSHLLQSKEDEVFVNGNGYRITWSATMREAKQKAKKGEAYE